MSAKTHYQKLYSLMRHMNYDPYEYPIILDYIVENEVPHEIIKSVQVSIRNRYSVESCVWHSQDDMKYRLLRKFRQEQWETECLDYIPF